MADLKLSIGDPATKRAYKAELKGADAEKLFGKKINETFHGELIGLPGYELKITGGSDKSGFPMRKEIEGQGRKRAVLAGGVGFHPEREGERKRRTLRGNTISDQLAQVNCVVTKAGAEPIAKLWNVDLTPKPKKVDTSEQAPRAFSKAEGEKKE